MNKKANLTMWIIGIIIVAVIVLLTLQQQSKTQLKLITDEPNNVVCLRDIDYSYTQANCERTKGQWLNQGLCGFCRCPDKSLGWLKLYGCMFITSTTGSRGD